MKKRYKEYPANLLEAMKINEIMGSDLDYENLSEDQMHGLTYALSALTEREMIVLTENYKDKMTVKAIADMHYLTVSRVKGIKRDAMKKIGNVSYLWFIVLGYQVRYESLERMCRREEDNYCSRYGITGEQHLFYQNISELNFPCRVYNCLQKSGIRTVRDLILFVQWKDWSHSIRNFGKKAEGIVLEALNEHGFLPEYYEPIPWKEAMPSLNKELAAFYNLNSSHHPSY